MATEQDRQDERDRMGNDPLHRPAEKLEEENPVESPAWQGERQDDAEQEREASQERASSSTEPAGRVAKSTEGQTIGGTEKTPGP
jgi:hypothetical protein